MRQNWFRYLLRPAVVGAMVGCVAYGVAELLQLAVPEWSVAYFVAVCVLVSIEAQYSYRVVQARSQFQTEAWRSRAIELAAILLLVKAGGYIGRPWGNVLDDVASWPDDPQRILDTKTIVAGILAFVSWLVSTEMARVLQRLDESSELHPGERPAIESLSRVFFWGGGILLIVSGIARIGLADLLNLRRPAVRGLVLNVLVYFALGLFVLGQARFATLHKQWREQRSKIAADLTGRWVRYSLGFLALAGVLAFLLPTSYTLALLDAIGTLVYVVLNVLSLLYMLILFLLSLPMWLLFRLLGGDAAAPGPLPRMVPPDSLPRRRGLGMPVPDSLRVLFFWLLVLGIVSYVIWSYLADHPEIWRSLASFAPIRALRALWRALRGRFRRWAATMRRAEQQRPGQVEVRGAQEPRWRFWLGLRSPREQVLYHYIGVLRRAKRSGLARRLPETPQEYGEVLGQSLAEAQQEMDLLTETFTEARYSLHAIEPDDGLHARRWGRRIRAELRGRKLSRRTGGRRPR